MDIQSASVYEESFVPALFAQWPARIVEAAGIKPGDRVLDVACGTGVLARKAYERAGSKGKVIGIDASEGMIAVASRKNPEIEWRCALAEALPFPDNSFDAVVSQFGLMFFEDKIQALKEMMRAVNPGGIVVVAVWNSLEKTAGFLALTNLLHRLFGENVADALRHPFSLGNPEELISLFRQAGCESPKLTTIEGSARFSSISDWIHINVRGWPPVGSQISDQGFQTLAQEAEQHFQEFVTPGGIVEFGISAHVVTALKN